MTGAGRFFVVTGGPGSGKSTLIEALQGAGCACLPEAGRSIIRDQMAVCGEALPWKDRALYAELMLAWELRSYRAAELLSGPVFFDRGLPDIAGYLRLEGLPVPGHLARAIALFRYQPLVFVAPPWPEIYRQDAERRQTPEVAVRTCEAMRAIYQENGYRLLELPRAPVEERVRFVLAAAGSAELR